MPPEGLELAALPDWQLPEGLGRPFGPDADHRHPQKIDGQYAAPRATQTPGVCADTRLYGRGGPLPQLTETSKNPVPSGACNFGQACERHTEWFSTDVPGKSWAGMGGAME